MHRSLLRLFLLLAQVLTLRAGPLVIHEWGTFTVLQDEEGNAVPGINTDDEPVPAFVHNVAPGLLITPTEAPAWYFQGVPSCHPDVTMRLETPVLYVHAPEGETPLLDVAVEFRGGWLTQFYPDAEVRAPNLDPQRQALGHLDPAQSGALHWKKVAVNVRSSLAQTADQVWLAPRDVESSYLQATDGACEKFLFYRGVARCDAPLRVSRRPGAEALEVRLQENAVGLRRPDRLWLVDIRNDGTGAFRLIETKPDEPWPAVPATFSEEEYSAAAVTSLRAELHRVLVHEGLFDDEAEALLKTWQLSYFKSAGLRLFFIVPGAWVERVLPLTVQPRGEITRVMVGRIELVTPGQRALLRQISSPAALNAKQELIAVLADASKTPDGVPSTNGVMRGWNTFKKIGITPPRIYGAYLELGRFRNALVLDELRRRPEDSLKRFIADFNLDAYRVPER